MSNLITDKCKKLKMPPTAKSVLMALADYASDAGYSWPSITALCDWTCFGRTAVIEAIKWLEASGVVKADRTDRYRTTYTVNPAHFSPSELVREANQSVMRTSSYCGGLVREPDDEVREPDDEVREPDTNHQEPSRTINKATIKKRASAHPPPLCPGDIDPQTWADWLALRKAKKAPVTETVMRQARAEAEKAGMPLTRFLEIWCARGSQGLQADWLKPHERAGPVPTSATQSKPSAAADFRGKSYAGTPIDQLPPDLRDAARAAIG